MRVAAVCALASLWLCCATAAAAAGGREFAAARLDSLLQRKSVPSHPTLPHLLLNSWRTGRLPRHCWKEASGRLLRNMRPRELSRCARRFLAFANRQLRKWRHKSALASFRYNTNITDANRKRMLRVDMLTSRFDKRLTLQALKFKKLQRRLRLPPLKMRMLRKLQHGLVYPTAAALKRSNELQAEMSQRYSFARGCYAEGSCLDSGEHHVKEFFANASSSYEQLRHLWQSWHSATGRPLKPLLLQLVPLLNSAARAGGSADYGQYEYAEDFEDKRFRSTVLSLYRQLEPLYRQLHAYLRHRLHRQFPGKFAADGLLPGHLADDQWGAQYRKWASAFAPYPEAKTPDLDAALRRRHAAGRLAVSAMPHLADAFFSSLGLPAMTAEFWRHSLFVQPRGRKVTCHGTAYDIFDTRRRDFRIKMCSRTDLSSFTTVHHEMGHIMYFMLYSGQPTVFREGANSGFHEAVGDTISLSVRTARHFRRIRFISDGRQTPQSLVNEQLSEALENVMFIPYAMTVDLWRWGVFSGSIAANGMNRHWWRLRAKYSGVGPPTNRSEAGADALGKYHVARNIPYIRYFVSFILKFQLYEAMCMAAGHKGELATCDFYKSTAAGSRLRNLLSLGSSRPWPEALRQLTGSGRISAKPLLRYFRPLLRWLRRYNKEHRVPIGWPTPANPLLAV